MFVARNLRTAGAILSKQVGGQARLPCLDCNQARPAAEIVPLLSAKALSSALAT